MKSSNRTGAGGTPATGGMLIRGTQTRAELFHGKRTQAEPYLKSGVVSWETNLDGE